MLSNELKPFSLSDLCEIRYGKDHKKLTDGKIPVYGTGGIMRYVDSYLYDKESVLIPRKGSLSNIYFVNGKFWTVDTLFWTKINEKIVFPKFLYYKLLTINFSEMNVGSAVPSLTTELLNRVIVDIPALPYQKAIANILSTLDDKIELNNKINKNFEEFAQTLYKRWFVDFEFPNENGEPYKSSGGEMVESELGLIPRNWLSGKLGDYSIVKSGFAFKSSWWSHIGDYVVKIKDLNDITIEYSNLHKVNPEYSSCAKDFKVGKGDILVAMTGATIGKIGIVTSSCENLYVNQRVGKFFLGDNPMEKLPYMHNLLRDERIINIIKSTGTGSAQPNISPSDIMNISIPYSTYYINRFNSLMYEFYNHYVLNIEQNKMLSKLRNDILPKLMNGEIEVPIEE